MPYEDDPTLYLRYDDRTSLVYSLPAPEDPDLAARLSRAGDRSISKYTPGASLSYNDAADTIELRLPYDIDLKVLTHEEMMEMIPGPVEVPVTALRTVARSGRATGVAFLPYKASEFEGTRGTLLAVEEAEGVVDPGGEVMALKWMNAPWGNPISKPTVPGTVNIRVDHDDGDVISFRPSPPPSLQEEPLADDLYAHQGRQYSRTPSIGSDRGSEGSAQAYGIGRV